MTVGLWKLSSLDCRRPPCYRPLNDSQIDLLLQLPCCCHSAESKPNEVRRARVVNLSWRHGRVDRRLHSKDRSSSGRTCRTSSADIHSWARRPWSKAWRTRCGWRRCWRTRSPTPWRCRCHSRGCWWCSRGSCSSWSRCRSSSRPQSMEWAPSGSARTSSKAT